MPVCALMSEIFGIPRFTFCTKIGMTDVPLLSPLFSGAYTVEEFRNYNNLYHRENGLDCFSIVGGWDLSWTRLQRCPGFVASFFAHASWSRTCKRTLRS